MKKLLLIAYVLLFSVIVVADNLILIRTNSYLQTKKVFNHSDLRVHYYQDDFVIATATDFTEIDSSYAILTREAWKKDHAYHIVWPVMDDQQYYEKISSVSNILYEDEHMMILETPFKNAKEIVPSRSHAIIAFHDEAARLPQKEAEMKVSYEANPIIEDLILQVDASLIQERVQHLQDYGTRDCFEPESVEAQNWIREQFEEMGLDVELQSFTIWGEDVSDNVIATKTGVNYPDEYVIVGAHYDSYSWSGNAPGADDNASGTSGVIETARILTQYDFDRSIIFAAWSGEEYGLYGSEAYASEAAVNEMNILGYFNMDMIAYLHEGDEIHTDMIAPSSAQPLVDFYTTTVETYLPDFSVEPGMLSGANSDHASFNNNGYMGIFPFEDSQNYSPYIHTSDDIVGLSFNSSEMARTFTQAMVASVSAKAGILGYSGQEDRSANTSFRVFPNPSEGKFSVFTNEPENSIIEVIDITGKTIRTIEDTRKIRFDISAYPEGVYFVRLIKPQETTTQKIIIR
ncbi:MAG: M28 family peptidase [Bacteroidales bacterium]|nr:M28 family peptidase [Bacteroidales bacterium]MCF8396917.1 M28 family peptidase [Bacteroidales bacterium]